MTDVVWQPEEIRAGVRWRIVQLLPADAWWFVDKEQRADGPWCVASPLVAWALVEVQDQADDDGPWQQFVGIDQWREPVSLKQSASYVRDRDIPERARLSDGGPAVEWPVRR